jgi:hypothetical protein
MVPKNSLTLAEVKKDFEYKWITIKIVMAGEGEDFRFVDDKQLGKLKAMYISGPNKIIIPAEDFRLVGSHIYETISIKEATKEIVDAIKEYEAKIIIYEYGVDMAIIHQQFVREREKFIFYGREYDYKEHLKKIHMLAGDANVILPYIEKEMELREE